VPSTIPVTPAYVRAEAWMAIIQGATALGYRGFEGYGDERPGQEVMVELKRLNAQLTRLAAAILASPAEGKITMALEGKLAGHFKATQHEGATYIFAQNIDLGPDAGQQEPGQAITPRAANAVITVAGLKKGAQVEVVDENRTIAADEGSFADHFAPLAEHVYKLPTP
jgi:hypothetical protein